MLALEESFVVSTIGEKVAVLLEIKRYMRLIEAEEELDALHAYDIAKADVGEAVPFEKAILEIEQTRPNYGIDAPSLVKGFFVGGAAALTIALAAILSPWSGQVSTLTVAALAGLAAAYTLGMDCYMLYVSPIGKVRGRQRLLDLVPWYGGEAVLDVGCGRGLFLVAAAQRVPSRPCGRHRPLEGGRSVRQSPRGHTIQRKGRRNRGESRSPDRGHP